MNGSADRPEEPGRRLESWKEIAVYFHRDVRTVQRWELREGMPVHRHLHDKSSSVYAFRTDLDSWVRSRHLRLSAEFPGEPSAGATAPRPGTAESGSTGQVVVDRAPGLAERHRSRRWTFVAILVVAAALAIGAWSLQRSDYFWTSPLAGVSTQIVADFDGTEQAAAVSRDGRLVAFLSNRDGTTDVWVTQLGTGQFHNLTHGSVPELVNPSVRTIAFSPDGALVTFWARRPDTGAISTWAVPTLGGQPRLYLEGAAEID